MPDRLVTSSRCCNTLRRYIDWKQGDLIFTAAQLPERVETTGETLELSLLARTALELAQKFNAIYHRHPMLQEKDEAVRASRLAATGIFSAALEELTELLGLTVPDRM